MPMYSIEQAVDVRCIADSVIYRSVHMEHVFSAHKLPPQSTHALLHVRFFMHAASKMRHLICIANAVNR